MVNNERFKGEQFKKENIDPSAYLLGVLSAFNNRYQAVANKGLDGVTWKQFFAMICIDLFKEAPMITELAAVMQSSHQNVKQILLKLQEKGYVRLIEDQEDRRRQRVEFTEKKQELLEKNADESLKFIHALYQGITEEELVTTIHTLEKMERNMQQL